MIVTRNNRELDKQMEEKFKLSSMIGALKELNDVDKIHYRNSIIITILAHTCKNPKEAMVALSSLQLHLYDTKK